MAIAYGGQTNSGVLSNTTSPSFTGPVISGSNPVLLILIANRDGGNLDANSVLVNGNAATYVNAWAGGGNGIQATAFLFVNPPSSATIQVNFAEQQDHACIFAPYFTGVDQSSPTGASNGNEDSASDNTNPSMNLTTLTNQSWIVGVVYDKTGNDLTAATGVTLPTGGQLAPNGSGDRAAFGYRGPVSPPASTSFGFVSNPHDDWVVVGFELNPAAAVTASPLSTFLMMGV